MIGGAGADIFEVRGAFGVETIADFGADDASPSARASTASARSPPTDLAGRIDDLGGDAWLDLGGGNGVLFLGVGGDELAGLLETNAAII